MLGPAVMLLAGLVLFPASPIMGILLIGGAVLVLPRSRKMDREIAAIEAANPQPAKDPANGCFSVAIFAFAMLLIAAAAAVQMGYQP